MLFGVNRPQSLRSGHTAFHQAQLADFNTQRKPILEAELSGVLELLAATRDSDCSSSYGRGTIRLSLRVRFHRVGRGGFQELA